MKKIVLTILSAGLVALAGMTFSACGDDGEGGVRTCDTCSLTAPTTLACVAKQCVQQCGGNDAAACAKCTADECAGCGNELTCAVCDHDCAVNASQRCVPREPHSLTCRDGVY